MTEPHSSSSTSNSPFQTQLPHICTPAASLGNPRELGWLAKKKTRKKSFIFGCWRAEHLRLWICRALGPRQQTSSATAVCSFSQLQNVPNPGGNASLERGAEEQTPSWPCRCSLTFGRSSDTSKGSRRKTFSFHCRVFFNVLLLGGNAPVKVGTVRGACLITFSLFAPSVYIVSLLITQFITS